MEIRNAPHIHANQIDKRVIYTFGSDASLCSKLEQRTSFLDSVESLGIRIVVSFGLAKFING